MKKVFVIFAIGFVFGMLFERAGGLKLFDDAFRRMTGFVDNMGNARDSQARKVERQMGKF